MVSGLQRLAKYQTELDNFDAERQELANAEKLFDLPITAYPHLLEVQKQMKGMQQVSHHFCFCVYIHFTRLIFSRPIFSNILLFRYRILKFNIDRSCA